MKCINHKNKDSVGTCTGCGNPFCADCMIKVGRKNLCKECASERLKNEESDSRNSKSPNIVVTQQTTNQHAKPGSDDDDKPRGSGFWLCFWIIVFWPAAIIYYFMRR